MLVRLLMSSHREAPEISKDPVADSTDGYAFVSPDKPDTVTLIANYIPLQGPAGGPNFYEFGDDVLYEIHVDNNGDGKTGSHVLGSKFACPPCNVGVLSTPDYEANLGQPAVHSLGNGGQVFAGQRAEEFYVDLGSIFDLGNLRPLQQFNVFGNAAGLTSAPGVNAANRLNVHCIAIQVPISQLTLSVHPTIGGWTSASRHGRQEHSPMTEYVPGPSSAGSVVLDVGGADAGEYTIWRDASTPADVVTIADGSVTSYHWH